MGVLAAIVLAAAAVRFAGLDAQSLWFDEVATLGVLRDDLPGTLGALRSSESTPPLYYVLAWAWTSVLGDGAAALRALSALLGTAAVALVGLAARRLAGDRAGWAAAALAAVSPVLWWYSQEARAYALMVALAAASVLALAVLLRAPSRRWWVAWAACGVLLVLTHYFGAFLVLAEALVLGRAALAWAVPAGLTGIALLPLATGQEDGRTAWIGGSPLGPRVEDVAVMLATASTRLVSSNSAAPGGAWWVLGLAGCAGVAALLVRQGRAARPLLLVAGAGLLVPLALALTPLDFFKDRNLLYAWPPLLVAAGVALRRGRAAVAALAALVVAQGAVLAAVAGDEALQRTDWRSAARALGPPAAPRAVVVQPGYEVSVLRHYGRRVVVAQTPVRVSELVVIGPQAQPPPGARVRRRGGVTTAVVRLPAPVVVRAPTAVELDARSAAAVRARAALLVRWARGQGRARAGEDLRALGPAPDTLPALDADMRDAARLVEGG